MGESVDQTPPASPVQTAQLVRAARRGDSGAFEQLIGRFERTALSVAYGVLRNPHDAGDVTQEAFIRAWQKLKDLRNPEGFGAWLCGIVRNLAADHYRRRKRESSVRAMDDPAEHAAAVPMLLDPSADLQQAERRQRIETALGALDEISRTAVVMRYYDGASSKQISEALGLSPAAIDMRLSRARNDLKQLLEKDVAHDER